MKFMTKIYALIIALCMFAGNGLYAQTTAGTDFWIAFGKNNDRSMDKLTFQIKIVATNEAKVTLKFTDLPSSSLSNRTITISAGTTRTITLTPDEKAAVYSDNSKWLKKSLHITSDQPVSVYALNSAQFTSDATNILPTNVLGTDYYHISYTGTKANYLDAITIVGTTDTTKVTCTSSTSSITRTLHNTGSTWYIEANENTDLTGWHITSDKPIAYFVTHQGAKIPDGNNSNPDNLFQQLAPTTSWGTHFFVPDIGVAAQSPLLVRVMASQDGTKITTEGESVTYKYLNKGQFVTLEVPNTGCFISSNKPVGVCSYLLSYVNSGTYGGPAMVWIPPVEQSVTSTTVSSFQIYMSEYHAIVVTPTNTKRNTTVKIGNGKTTSLSGASWTDMAGYSYTRYQMTGDDPHTFSNPAGLTVLVFGLGDSESYYYLGGASMYNLEMKFSVNGKNFQDISGKTICTENVKLKAEILYANKADGYLQWYIDDNLEDDATDELEWNKTLSPGKHTIEMRVLDKGVSKKLKTEIFIEKPVASITGPDEIFVGETTTLSPTTGGTWKSSNSAFATVDNNGIVTGVAEGKAKFTFTSNAGCTAETDSVTVKKAIVTIAVNDTVPVIYNSTIDFDALANDTFSCDRSLMSLDTLAGSSLRYGSLTINGDATFTYKADKGHYGTDSLEYVITCETDSDTAMIYFTVSEPPHITVENRSVDTACTGTSYTFKASYTDTDGVFTGSGEKLAYRWEYSKNGYSWTSLGVDNTLAATSVNSTYTIDSVTDGDEGYYRFVVGSPSTIDSPVRIVSATISLFVSKIFQAADLRIMIAPTNTQHSVYLTSFLDTTGITSVKWSSTQNYAVNFSDEASGELDAQKLTSRNVYTFKYTVESKCGASSANAYVLTSKDKLPVKNNREIFICKDMESSKYVQLNQILGLEDGGQWSYPDDDNKVDKIVSGNVTVSSSKYAKARIFNAQKAYHEATDPSYSMPEKPNVKVFKFNYTSVSGTVYGFKLIVE